MGYNYAVLGAGRQGTASAYDLAMHGSCQKLVLVDDNFEQAQASCQRINQLVQKTLAEPKQLNISHEEKLVDFLRAIDVCISAVPYRFNLAITRAAVDAKTSMCDLGGNTEIVFRQLEQDAAARTAGITVIPDCGMAPGLTANLAAYAITLLDQPEEIYIWDGGLPKHPKEPWNYILTFNFEGLINEYYGTTEFLRDGRITQVQSFEEYELVKFPEPVGELEAFATTGGASTAPRTYLGRLRVYQNKTLRYKAHYQQWKVFKDAGFFKTQPVQVDGQKFRPRDLLKAVVEPQIRAKPGEEDIGIIRVKCLGEKAGKPAEVILEVIDYYDPQTGFTAMERLTGWHAAIVAQTIARGETPTGAVPLEIALPGKKIVEEFRNRGIEIREYIEIK
jgi:lysine 6-dehydrogenase